MATAKKTKPVAPHHHPSPRTKLHLVPEKDAKGKPRWALKTAGSNGVIIMMDVSKKYILQRARMLLIDLWESPNRVRGQLLIHDKKGILMKEYTYGVDPVRSVG